MKSTSIITAFLLLTASGCGDSNPNVTRARLSLKNLEKALMEYQSQHGFPDKLETLADEKSTAGGALLPAHGLTDPWGRPFQFDPNQLHPDTARPLIWSEGPNPGQPGSKIENWTIKED